MTYPVGQRTEAQSIEVTVRCHTTIQAELGMKPSSPDFQPRTFLPCGDYDFIKTFNLMVSLLGKQNSLYLPHKAFLSLVKVSTLSKVSSLRMSRAI